MRIAFILSFAANVTLSLVYLFILPERIAIHFGPGGMANGWASNYVNTFIFLGIHTLLFFSLYLPPRLMFICPVKWVNLPNKHYWWAPENRPQLVAKLSYLMYQFGLALFIFLFVIGLLTIQANLSEPVRLNEKLFFPIFILFMVYTVVWFITLFRSFRVPMDK